MVKSESRITLTTTAQKIVEANPKRVSLFLMNVPGTQQIYIGTDNHISATNGLWIPPGMHFSFNRLDGDMATHAYYGITNAATEVLIVNEGFEPEV